MRLLWPKRGYRCSAATRSRAFAINPACAGFARPRKIADAAVAAVAGARAAERGQRPLLADRWKRLLAPPADAELRAQRLGRDVERWLGLREDIAALEAQLGDLLAGTDGQILTTLPGVAVIRAASFAAHALPIERWPTAEHLYSATGLAPASQLRDHPSRR